MMQGIHPSYFSLLDEMEGKDRPFETRCKKLAHRPTTENLSEPTFHERRWNWMTVLMFGVAIGVSVGGYFVFQRQSPVASPTATAAPAREDGTARDLELVKQILVGLVGTVQRLSDGQETKVIKNVAADREAESIPIKVRVERANLRERPEISSRSIMIVPKDTELLGMPSIEGWTAVTTPLGGQAWVSSELVTEVQSE